MVGKPEVLILALQTSSLLPGRWQILVWTISKGAGLALTQQMISFFSQKQDFGSAQLVAFGMTRRSGRSAENDPGLSAILNSHSDASCLVGKSWDFHVTTALNVSLEENLSMIADSVAAAKACKQESMF